MPESDNAPVWDGSRRGHYEVWYLTLNHRPTGTGFWIRMTLEVPLPGRGDPHARVWFAAFDSEEPGRGFAVNRAYPIGDLELSASPFAVRIGRALLGHDHASGSIGGSGHSARWELAWPPAERTHRQLPEVVYRTHFADTRVVSPNLDVPVRGTIEIDGRTLVLDGEPGGQSHLFGRKHAHAWAWAHCNAFSGRPGAVLEAITVRLKRGIVLPPLTLLTLYLDGAVYRFTRLTDALFSRGSFATARYAFRAAGRDVRIAGELACRPEDMVLAEYVDPDGEPVFCANTEVADAQVTLSRRLPHGWEEERLVADATGHFEVAGRAPDPAVTRRHTAVD